MSTLAVFQSGLRNIMALLAQQFALPRMSEYYEFLNRMFRFPARYGGNPGILGISASVDVEGRDGQGNEGSESKHLANPRSD